MYKQRRHRTTIYGHHTTILDVLESFCYWKNRTTMLSIVLRCKKSMSHHITALSIVLRCKKSLSHRTTTLPSYCDVKSHSINYIKAQLHTRGGGRDFGERNRLLEQEIWREGWRPSKLISGYQFHVMNPSFILVIYALAMSS
jgi:hypothetical protein